MYNLNWSRSDLTRQKLGTFCEYYAKMSLASYGVSIYTSEVDDHEREPSGLRSSGGKSL